MTSLLFPLSLSALHHLFQYLRYFPYFVLLFESFDCLSQMCNSRRHWSKVHDANLTCFPISSRIFKLCAQNITNGCALRPPLHSTRPWFSRVPLAQSSSPCLHVHRSFYSVYRTALYVLPFIPGFQRQTLYMRTLSRALPLAGPTPYNLSNIWNSSPRPQILDQFSYGYRE